MRQFTYLLQVRTACVLCTVVSYKRLFLLSEADAFAVRGARPGAPLATALEAGAHDATAGLRLQLFELATMRIGKKMDRQALVPRDREASELWKRVSAKDPEEIMPPPDSNHRLSPEQIELLGRWIDQGAEYEGHWSFQTVTAPKGASIDSLIRAQFEGSGLRPAPPANRETLLRRLTQDLTGLPPTPEEIDAFLADQMNAIR